ncbi:MAG: hypothetical protein HYZ28_25490 [Myxococcales bacterium]|nr:hypothetical protein [Myxococcales bacterium]
MVVYLVNGSFWSIIEERWEGETPNGELLIYKRETHVPEESHRNGIYAVILP